MTNPYISLDLPGDAKRHNVQTRHLLRVHPLCFFCHFRMWLYHHRIRWLYWVWRSNLPKSRCWPIHIRHYQLSFQAWDRPTEKEPCDRANQGVVLWQTRKARGCIVFFSYWSWHDPMVGLEYQCQADYSIISRAVLIFLNFFLCHEQSELFNRRMLYPLLSLPTGGQMMLTLKAGLYSSCLS